MHMYVGLPTGVSEADYRVLIARALRTKALERRIGKWAARNQTALWLGESEFGAWLRTAWDGVVQSRDPAHAVYGADAIPFFWGEVQVRQAASGQVNWERVSDYLWRESGKWGQKQVPEGFAMPGRSWGMWGIRPEESSADVEKAAAMELRRLLLALLRARGVEYPKVRGLDGLTVYSVPKELGARLLTCATEVGHSKALLRAAAAAPPSHSAVL